MHLVIGVSIVLSVVILMSMTGRGGGNFYVPLLIALGFQAHQAATTVQLILIASAAAAVLVFSSQRAVD